MNRVLSIFILLFVVPIAAASQLAPDPRGVYLNQFKGGFAGVEWFQVTPMQGTPGRYRLADIHGGGFNATIHDGAIVIDNDVGNGSFTTPDAFTIKPTLGGKAFTFESSRAPFTTADFPLAFSPPQLGNPALAGKWTSLTQTRDPKTGAAIDGGDEALVLSVVDTSLRITDPQGLYFQGVFVSANRVVFRAIEGVSARRPEYVTFPGSAINFEQDMLGEALFADADHFTATILLQSRAKLGQQRQRLITFQAKRVAAE